METMSDNLLQEVYVFLSNPLYAKNSDKFWEPFRSRLLFASQRGWHQRKWSHLMTFLVVSGASHAQKVRE